VSDKGKGQKSKRGKEGGSRKKVVVLAENWTESKLLLGYLNIKCTVHYTSKGTRRKGWGGTLQILGQVIGMHAVKNAEGKKREK